MYTALSFFIFVAAAVAIALLWFRLEFVSERLGEFVRRVEWLELQNIERAEAPRRPGSAFARRRNTQPVPRPPTPPGAAAIGLDGRDPP